MSLSSPLLIETILRDAGNIPRLEGHMARLERSAAALGYLVDIPAARAILLSAHGPDTARLRLTLAQNGQLDLTVSPHSHMPVSTVWRLGIARTRLDETDPLLRYKTTSRAAYDAARAEMGEEFDEMIMLNSRGEVCEGTITSIFADFGDGLVTPPLSCGLLDGVMRRQLLEKGKVREQVISPAQLSDAKSIYMGNALRGLIRAILS